MLGLLVLIVNLNQRPILGFDSWCTLNLDQDHYGYPANQQPAQWVRIFIPIPPNATEMQLTSKDGRTAYINESMQIEGFIYVSVQYWYHTLELYIGWKHATGVSCEQTKVYYGSVPWEMDSGGIVQV